MIDQFIQKLQTAGLELLDWEFAESLWLAQYLPRPSRRPPKVAEASGQPPLSGGEPKASVPGPEVETPLSETPPGRSVREASASLPPVQPRVPAQTGSDSSLEFLSPSAPALPHKLELMRALRPLRRRVPSRLFALLDETATAERIAEQGIWVPVLRPARTRWLDAMLVMDRGRSMPIWHKTFSELERLLQGQGLFRDVRAWELDTHQDQGPPGLRPMGSSAPFERSPKELIESRGRRLILLVSDCVSPAWHSGAVTRLLEEWGRYGPVALVHLLPRSLWGRTALRRAVAAELHGHSPGVPNHKLESMPLIEFADDVSHHLAVPVVTLEKTSLERWALLVAGRPKAWAPGVLLKRESPDTRQPVATQEPRARGAPLSADERVKRFRGTASPIAQTLAGLLAATPLSLPVMNLVRQTMLPDAEQVHLAEVFLGGLMHEVRADESPRDPDEVQYDFHEGVRDLLLQSMSTGDSLEVLRRTSRFLERRLGQSFDFRAILSAPGTPTSQELQPFAHVSETVLRQLGGEYAELADRLEDGEVHPGALGPQTTKTTSSDRPAHRKAARQEKTPVRSSRGSLVWSKKLSASDAQQVKKGSNPVGGIRLTQARFEFEGSRIDHTRYFRHQLFGHYLWDIRTRKPYSESTMVPFDVAILDKHLGVVTLEVSHKPSGEADQRNYTTILHLGPLAKFFREYNLRGHQLNLYAPPKGEDTPFFIDIV